MEFGAASVLAGDVLVEKFGSAFRFRLEQRGARRKWICIFFGLGELRDLGFRGLGLSGLGL